MASPTIIVGPPMKLDWSRDSVKKVLKTEVNTAFDKSKEAVKEKGRELAGPYIDGACAAASIALKAKVTIKAPVVLPLASPLIDACTGCAAEAVKKVAPSAIDAIVETTCDAAKGVVNSGVDKTVDCGFLVKEKYC